MKKRFKISGFLGSLVLFTAVSGGVSYYIGNFSFDLENFMSVLIITVFSLIVSFDEGSENKHDE